MEDFVEPESVRWVPVDSSAVDDDEYLRRLICDYPTRAAFPFSEEEAREYAEAWDVD